MKTAFVYREGNPFIESLIQQQKDVVVIKLKYGEEKSWEETIKREILPGTAVFCDMTAETFVREAYPGQNIRPIYAGLSLASYENRNVYYDLILSEAKKYEHLVFMLDNITDHIDIFEERERRMSVCSCKKDELEKKIRSEIVDEIIALLTESGIEVRWLTGETQEEEETLLIDHHAVRHLPKKHGITCKLICPCCIEQIYARNLFREFPGIKFVS